MKQEEKVAEFILEHYPPAQTWPDGDLLRWVRWTTSEGFLSAVKDDAENIVGVGIARPIMRRQDGFETDAFDPEGSIVFVDLVISRHFAVLPLLALQLQKRFGVRESIAYRRHKRCASTIEVRPYAKFRHALIQKGKAHVTT